MKRAPYVATVERFGELNTPAPVMVPTWDEAERAVRDGRASALERLIWGNERTGAFTAMAFRADLAAVLAELKK